MQRAEPRRMRALMQLLLPAPPPHPRCCQSCAAGTLHHRDADEDVRAGPAPVLHVCLQPLRLLRGVQWHPGGAAGGVRGHEPPGHLCAALHPSASPLQDHQVSSRYPCGQQTEAWLHSSSFLTVWKRSDTLPCPLTLLLCF